ncbi:MULTISPECIES: hypothetical protein [Klebsiella]|uniref:hypothetical protein n=1 Tax=Klebsiella TaxID=570 RepID=UPI0018A2C257|nr:MULTISPECIES: hypothetical protein [Klebsiella]MBF7793116.1 hypothetical protein [Klebsiella pneumoniae]MBF7799236.1 hypothetical protein [Klebsiella pneumoniae]MBZ7765358.1 hypothetical protein [Klebsiella michiganensis]HBS6596701.1 hypothetical protein [Klebsiella pneumoniae]HCA6517861.1 hypothetical protein [Klebsiella pneumoniae]
MTYSEVISIISLIASIIAVPLSAYFGYKNALKIEKRKEFNAISDKISIQLEKERNLIASGYGDFPNVTLSYADIIPLLIVSNTYERKAIDTAYKEYENAYAACTKIVAGSLRLDGEAALEESISRLIACCKRK